MIENLHLAPRPSPAPVARGRSPALDALRSGAARAERLYIGQTLRRGAHAVPAMVALNVLRELDLLFTYAINERATRSGLATCPADAPSRIKLCVLSSICPTSAGDRDRYRTNALGRVRLDRTAFHASGRSSSPSGMGEDRIAEMLLATVHWHVLTAEKLRACNRATPPGR
ncbi:MULTISPECIES: hypothetical protein [unclassified Sphingomonas]|uniref:hypothetical protein n=1 Tax=unclassified Sphingomonas TaxID=196159 RepID=UPI0012E2333A|nr:MULTISPECIES: hypothetical protein [unclassified Sphingomonas]